MKVPKSVLLVDDEKTIRKIYSNVLRKMGIETVVTADNGENAFKKYSGFNFEFVVLDILMPRMDGLEVLKKIREINPSATVLMHTSITDKDLVEQCIESGAYSYILKSNDLIIFQEKLLEVFNKKKIYWQLSRSSPARMTAKLEEHMLQPDEEEFVEITVGTEFETKEPEPELIVKKPRSIWSDKIKATISEEK